jgi:hypothetical protein
MLKNPVSGVLASLRGSTYRSVRLTSLLAAALPTDFLSLLLGSTYRKSLRYLEMVKDGR